MKIAILIPYVQSHCVGPDCVRLAGPADLEIHLVDSTSKYNITNIPRSEVQSEVKNSGYPRSENYTPRAFTTETSASSLEVSNIYSYTSSSSSSSSSASSYSTSTLGSATKTTDNAESGDAGGEGQFSKTQAYNYSGSAYSDTTDTESVTSAHSDQFDGYKFPVSEAGNEEYFTAYGFRGYSASDFEPSESDSEGSTADEMAGPNNSKVANSGYGSGDTSTASAPNFGRPINTGYGYGPSKELNSAIFHDTTTRSFGKINPNSGLDSSNPNNDSAGHSGNTGVLMDTNTGYAYTPNSNGGPPNLHTTLNSNSGYGSAASNLSDDLSKLSISNTAATPNSNSSPISREGSANFSNGSGSSDSSANQPAAKNIITSSNYGYSSNEASTKGSDISGYGYSSSSVPSSDGSGYK